MESYMLKKMPHIFTTGRSGSAFCADLLQLNLGISVSEWFSIDECESLINKGVCDSKEQYLLHVFFLLNGGSPTNVVKITPGVFESDYWGQDIISNLIFNEAIRSSGDAILLIRKDPIDTIISFAYALITGVWHSHSSISSDPIVLKSDEEILQFLTHRSIYFLECEIKTIQLIYNTQENYKVFYYEGLRDNCEEFSINILKCYSLLNFQKDHIIMPSIKKLVRENVMAEKIDRLSRSIALNNQTVQNLLKLRRDALNRVDKLFF